MEREKEEGEGGEGVLYYYTLKWDRMERRFQYLLKILRLSEGIEKGSEGARAYIYIRAHGNDPSSKLFPKGLPCVPTIRSPPVSPPPTPFASPRHCRKEVWRFISSFQSSEMFGGEVVCVRGVIVFWWLIWIGLGIFYLMSVYWDIFVRVR